MLCFFFCGKKLRVTKYCWFLRCKPCLLKRLKTIFSLCSWENNKKIFTTRCKSSFANKKTLCFLPLVGMLGEIKLGGSERRKTCVCFCVFSHGFASCRFLASLLTLTVFLLPSLSRNWGFLVVQFSCLLLPISFSITSHRLLLLRYRMHSI